MYRRRHSRRAGKRKNTCRKTMKLQLRRRKKRLKLLQTRWLRAFIYRVRTFIFR